MSFYTAVETGAAGTNAKVHVPMGVRQKTADRGTIEYKSTTPGMNTFCGQQRLKPQSSFAGNNNMFSAGNQLDYWVGFNGYLDQGMRLELVCSVNPTLTTGALTVFPPCLIDRVEWYDSNQNIFATIYQDQIWIGERLLWGKDKSNFENNANGLTSTYGPTTGMGASAKAIWEIDLPSPMTDCQIKGNIIPQKSLVRLYFSAVGISAGTPSDLFCTSCDIIQLCDQLAPVVENKELVLKSKSQLAYRCLNPQRICSYSFQAVASQYYDVQLVSGTQLSAYMFFVIRPTPITSANYSSFITLSQYEFYDQSITLQGITMTGPMQQYVHAQKFGGDIMNSALGAGIYPISFSINPQAAKNGNQNGFYSLTTREVIRVFFPAGFSTTNVVMDVYSYDYAELDIFGGKLEYKK